MAFFPVNGKGRRTDIFWIRSNNDGTEFQNFLLTAGTRDFHEYSSFTLCLSVCLFCLPLSFSVPLPITPPQTDGLLSQIEAK